MGLTYNIKEQARALGFDDCGIACSHLLREGQAYFGQWLKGGCHGGLHYLERNIDKRFDPSQLVEGARSVIVCVMSYNRGPREDDDRPRIASYAWAADYHDTIRERLQSLLAYIRREVPEVRGRVFVDTAPLHEKSWAVEAGLGWIGRNSLFIHPCFGSYVLLGEVVVDLELDYDARYAEEGCGHCRACMSACPNGAIIAPKVLDARRCIARLTIEAPSMRAETEQCLPAGATACHGWIFGCDVCQMVCPHNKRAPVLNHPIFLPQGGVDRMTRDEWMRLTPEEFTLRFGRTPISRSSLARIQSLLREE